MNNLQFAINMELEGERYYKDQAENNRNNSLYSVCKMMAEEEKKHAQLLTDLMNEKPYAYTDTDTLAQARSIFANIGDIKVEGIQVPDQFDFYRIASEKEKQSIELYTEFQAKAKNDAERALFAFLIEQEENHFAILDELAQLLRSGEEWVENAEFGIRDEY